MSARWLASLRKTEMLADPSRSQSVAWHDPFVEGASALPEDVVFPVDALAVHNVATLASTLRG